MAPSQQKVFESTGKIQVTLVKSLIGTKESHRACARGLGLRRLNHTVFVEDTLAVRGMINKIYYLVKCEVLNATQ